MIKKYKRKEVFRFAFNPPLDAQFAVLVNGRKIDRMMHPCKIIDISPRGMKIFTDVDILKNYHYPPDLLQFEMHFVLDITKIQAIGHVRWSKAYANGAYFGLLFRNQPGIEELIVSELKRRRRKEVFAKKHVDFRQF